MRFPLWHGRRQWLAAASGLVAVALAVAVILVLGQGLVAASQPGAKAPTFYQQTNLVSDVNGTAARVAPQLVNAWGLSHGPTTPWWVSDNGSSAATLYTGAGAPFPSGSGLVVTVPAPTESAAGSTATPTGNTYNGTNGFRITDAATGKSGPALFLFATEDGTISGWNPTVNQQQAILAADNSARGNAVYKGLTLGAVGPNSFLYVANFRAGTVDVFDSRFAPAQVSGAFTDAQIPSGFAPFNIANVGGQLYVAYAKQDAAKHDDVAGPGNGYVDVYSTSGRLIRRLIKGGSLSSPWGLTLSPNGFGQFSGDLLVGNFGDGRINAFDPQTGAWRGALESAKDRPLVIPGLWGLAFGNGSAAGPTTTLFFAAGINHEAHGLFGSVTPATTSGTSTAPAASGPGY